MVDQFRQEQSGLPFASTLPILKIADFVTPITIHPWTQVANNPHLESGADGGRLIWELVNPFIWMRPVGGALDTFIRLADAPPFDLLAFATQWGPLGICQHGKPSGHMVRSKGCSCDQLGWNEGAPWEPLDAWYRYARQLRAILAVAARLHRKQPGRLEDWDTVENGEPTDPRWNSQNSDKDAKDVTDWWNLSRHGHGTPGVEGERESIAWCVTNWLRYAQLQPQFLALPEEGYLGVLLGRDLTSALALELAGALASPFGIHQCDSSGNPYVPAGRRPRDDRRKYCSSCSGEPLGGGARKRRPSLAAKRLWARRNRHPLTG